MQGLLKMIIKIGLSLYLNNITCTSSAEVQVVRKTASIHYEQIWLCPQQKNVHICAILVDLKM